MKILFLFAISFLIHADPGEGDKVVEAEPGSEIEVSSEKNQPDENPPTRASTTVATEPCHEIKYRFYFTRKTRITSRVAKKWKTKISWWINSYNNHCKPKVPLCGPTRLKDDIDVVLMGTHKGRPKEYTKFRSDSTTKNYIPSYRYLKGIDNFDGKVKGTLSKERNTEASKAEDADPKTFHIGVFKEVVIRSRGNEHLTDGKGNTSSNVMAAKKAINNRGAQHEAGHLFGIEDHTGGIMSKVPPNRNNLKGRYGNERTGGWDIKSVRDSRCRAIQSHLQIQ